MSRVSEEGVCFFVLRNGENVWRDVLRNVFLIDDLLHTSQLTLLFRIFL
jgi:hypothetical protein